jgi:hypothetical protein
LAQGIDTGVLDQQQAIGLRLLAVALHQRLLQGPNIGKGG